MSGKCFSCVECGAPTKGLCAECKCSVCDKHSYSYVDGNNGSITRNSPELCSPCYRINYPDTWRRQA